MDEEALKTSKQLAQKNNITNLNFISKHSTDVTKPIKADIVVSETLGSFALEENILETMRDARKFLKEDGKMIPKRLAMFVAPVIGKTLHEEIFGGMDKIKHDFNLDFSMGSDIVASQMYAKSVPSREILNQKKGGKLLDVIDFNEENESIRQSDIISWKIPSTKITIYGFCIWWKCELSHGLFLSTSPFSPKTHWDQIYLPMRGEMVCMRCSEFCRSIHAEDR